MKLLLKFNMYFLRISILLLSILSLIMFVNFNNIFGPLSKVDTDKSHLINWVNTAPAPICQCQLI